MNCKEALNRECAQCGTSLDDYAAVGYDGPADHQGTPRPGDRRCGPFIRWITMCQGCADKHFDAEEEETHA